MSTHTAALETEKLRVAEMFYSLQGEGRSSGCPAVFLRLQHCNLLCGRDDASWRCDTLDVWRRGQALTFAEIIDSWRAKGWLSHLASHAHLVVTGGEPLLQQQALSAFLPYLFAQELESGKESPRAERSGLRPAVEIETNATLVATSDLDAGVAQYNCSPKGANSGNSRPQRHNVAALQAWVSNPKAVFKFVVSTREDVEQIKAEYIDPYGIDMSRVWLMPAADTLAMLQKSERRVFALCQEYHYNYSTRLQLQVWDQATGI